MNERAKLIRKEIKEFEMEFGKSWKKHMKEHKKVMDDTRKRRMIEELKE